MSKVIAAGLIFLMAVAITYFQGWWPTMLLWLGKQTQVPNYLILFFVLTLFLTPFLAIVWNRKFAGETLQQKVERLLNNTRDNSIPVTFLLRNARDIAHARGEQEIEQQFRRELNGYDDVAPINYPEIRKIYGEAQVFSPYAGWQPANFADAKSREVCTFAPCGTGMATIENFTNNTNNTMVYAHDADAKQRIVDAFEGATDFRLILSRSQFVRIAEATRADIHEWVLSIMRS